MIVSLELSWEFRVIDDVTGNADILAKLTRLRFSSVFVTSMAFLAQHTLPSSHPTAII